MGFMIAGSFYIFQCRKKDAACLAGFLTHKSSGIQPDISSGLHSD